MCGPAAPIIAIAAAMTAATGKMVSSIGQANQYKHQASIDQENARRSNAQARDAIENTNLEAQRRYREQSRLSGQQTAAMAANGVDLNFGSPTDIARDTAMIGAEDVSQIYKAGRERTVGFEMNAWTHRSSAAANKAKAKGAITEGIFGALSSALGGASQISSMKRPVG